MGNPFFPNLWHQEHWHNSHCQCGHGLFDDPLIGMGFLGFLFEYMFNDMMNFRGGHTWVYSWMSYGTVMPDGCWMAKSRMTHTVNGVTKLA